MSLDDEQVRFYLKHRERIEEWAALRSHAASAMDEWLRTLQPAIEALASELGQVRVDAFTGSDQGLPKYCLRRPAWPMQEEGDPAACICLEWKRGWTLPQGDWAPYVGLLSSKEYPVGAAIREMEALRETRRGRDKVGSGAWAAWRSVPADAGFPEVKDGYRDHLVESLRTVWKAYAPLIDDAVRRVAAAGAKRK